MIKLQTFDKKAIKEINAPITDIYPNEVAWTYLVGEIAQKNDEIYEMISGFKPQKSHKIYCEGQPLTPYSSNLEGNSYIDMALGSLDIRQRTTSGIEFSKQCGGSVCLLEAKYLSDLSNKTEHSPTRNQMDRVIENLLCLNDGGNSPEKTVFTLLTPRIFKQQFGTRLYSFKFDQYKTLLENSEYETLYNLIVLSDDESDFRKEKRDARAKLKGRLENLEIRWVTFEDIFEKFDPTLKDLDLTDKKSVLLLWKQLKLHQRKLSKKKLRRRNIRKCH